MAKQIYVEAVQAEEVSNSITAKDFRKFSFVIILRNRIFCVGPALSSLILTNFRPGGCYRTSVFVDRLIESVESPKTWLFSTLNQQSLKAKKRRSVSASYTNLGLFSALNARKIRFRAIHW